MDINIKDFQIAYTKIKPFIKKTKLIHYKNNIYLKTPNADLGILLGMGVVKIKNQGSFAETN